MSDLLKDSATSAGLVQPGDEADTPVRGVLLRARIIMGTATFFDAFDALAIAFVLPVLVGAWHLSTAQVGFLIAAGFIGQLFGSLGFGWLAERVGRVRVSAITVGIFALASLACVFANGFEVLLILRVIQGIGLGGEVPAASAYINELSPAKSRGRFFMLYELMFPAGLLFAAVVGSLVVPTFGWEAMFLIGGLPALMALFMRRLLPESPRWLMSRGRVAEAKESFARFYPGVPFNLAIAPIASTKRTHLWRELFTGIYKKRTFAIWGMWVCAYVLTYGVTTWLPTVYRTVFNLPLNVSLQYSVITNLAAFIGAVFCALLIDRVGRKPWFTWCFLLGGLAMGGLYIEGATTPVAVVVGVSFSYLFIGSCATALYLYTPELYSVRVRAFGVSVASAWLRLGSAAGPIIVGSILTGNNLSSVFGVFALLAVAGSAITIWLGVETANRSLEEISP